MLEHPQDQLSKRAAELGLDRGEILEKIQRRLDARYPSRTRAISLHRGLLKIITPSSSVAAELRLHQVELLAQFDTLSPTHDILKLQIQIRSLS